MVGTVLLAMGAIAAFFVPAAIALAKAEGEAQVVELQREASDAAARLDPRGADPDNPSDTSGRSDREGSERPRRSGTRHDYAVYDASGHRLSGTGPEIADTAVRAAMAGTSTTGLVGQERVAAVPLSSGGAVRAAEQASEADNRTRAAVLRLGLAALIVVAAGSIAAWLLARRLTKPLRQLGRSAARLGGGDFTATAATTGIREIDEVADALNSSATRIGTLVERERRLTADASHQLRTPITGLRLALEGELAAPRPDSTAVIREALGAVDRLEATVTALTDLARDEASTDPFEVDQVVAAAVHRWKPLFSRASRSIVVGTPTGAISQTRRVAIETILDVLLDNALHHGAGVVSIDTDTASGSARLLVADEGSCSLADGRLFERHHSSTGSTGIGLHLARTLSEAEGARLRLIRQAPTTFQLLLPLRHPDEPDASDGSDGADVALGGVSTVD